MDIWRRLAWLNGFLISVGILLLKEIVVARPETGVHFWSFGFGSIGLFFLLLGVAIIASIVARSWRLLAILVGHLVVYWLVIFSIGSWLAETRHLFDLDD